MAVSKRIKQVELKNGSYVVQGEGGTTVTVRLDGTLGPDQSLVYDIAGTEYRLDGPLDPEEDRELGDSLFWTFGNTVSFKMGEADFERSFGTDDGTIAVTLLENGAPLDTVDRDFINLESSGTEVGDFIPTDLMLTDQFGAERTVLSQTDTRPALIEVGALWCQPTIKLAEDHADFIDALAGDFVSMTFMAQNYAAEDMSVADARLFALAYDIEAPVYIGERVSDVFGYVGSLPTFLLVDQVTGEVLQSFAGVWLDEPAEGTRRDADAALAAVEAQSDVRGLRLDGGDEVDLLYGSVRADVVRGGAGGDIVDAGIGNDRVSGQAGKDILLAGRGDDTARGGAGNDILYGGDGADSLAGGAGYDELHGEAGDDRLQGNDGSDALYGGAGDDALFGDQGRDHLSGDAGDDMLRGGTESDTLDGGAGADRLSGEDHADVLLGKAGDDLLRGGRGRDELLGGAGDDTLLGGSHFDRLSGQKGNDLLDGGAGDDWLYAGPGDDTLTGGAGADDFTFYTEIGTATITDFTPGEDRFFFETGYSGGRTAAEIEAAARVVDGDVVIDLWDGQQIVIEGLTVTDGLADSIELYS